MEFWNFGILLCKSLISLKKVDSNFTLRIGPLYIKTLKFQFSVSFALIPKFQLARSSSKRDWNLGIISPTRETLSHRLAHAPTRAETYNWFHWAKEKPHQSCDWWGCVITSTVHRMHQSLGAVQPHWVRMCHHVH
jgi:hypothetical protein